MLYHLGNPVYNAIVRHRSKWINMKDDQCLKKQPEETNCDGPDVVTNIQ